MRNYVILDVFTDRPLAGNPLAVVLDTEGLATEEMRQIAKEFNLSETVFVHPPANSGHRADLRIFTPGIEIPFAGHPTIGTAILLAQLDGLENGETRNFIVKEQVGPVKCFVKRNEDEWTARFELPQLPTLKVVYPDMTLLTEALGLAKNQIGLPGHYASVCDGGVPYPIIPLSGLKAMQDICINAQALGACMAEIGGLAEIYVYTTECVHTGSDYHVRMFSPAFGITEDPATGSAAASLAAHIMEVEKPADGTYSYIIEQGLEMGRPSRIELTLNVARGTLASASIGGQAVITADGHLRI